MERMKAVRVHGYGGPEVLRFEDAPRPSPGSGEVLIKVPHRICESHRLEGASRLLEGLCSSPLPFIPGWDGSGVVEAVGTERHEVQERR